jgi:glycosyltransferase involved in cell wall biosynthesis
MLTARSMLEWFAGLAIGAVVHAEHYAGAVRRVCPGPVASIPLAYPDPNFPIPRPIDNEITIITLGHVNPNKCADRVIMAIASSKELRLHCRYRLVGPFEESERDRLLRLARRVGVAAPEFTGWVSDSHLHSEIERADVICCLRNPVLEGGSASAIFGMLSGRPLLVSNHGVYAEIPDDLVFKCQPREETTEVARHLTSILRDPAAAQARGSGAREYASRHHNPSRYVEALLPLLKDAVTVGPTITASIAIGRILASFGLKPDDAAATRAVSPLASLFG